MGIRVIAKLVDTRLVTVGYRLYNTKTYEFIDMSVERAILELQKYGGKGEGVHIINTPHSNLVFDDGLESRLPLVNNKNECVRNDFVIIVQSEYNKDNDEIVHTCTDYSGVTMKIGEGELVDQYEEVGFYNAEVDDFELVVNKPSDINKVNTPQNLGVDSEIKLSIKDLSESQRKVVTSYYLWYTKEKYLDLAKSIRLELAPGKVKALTELRGNTEWEFAGIVDTGVFGAVHCTLGHPLRYAYYAKPLGGGGVAGDEIIFGSTCASDFFSISKKDMNHLNKVRRIMVQEISDIALIQRNNLVAVEDRKAELFYSLKNELGDNNFKSIVGKKVYDYINAFRSVGLSLPKSLIREAIKYLNFGGIREVLYGIPRGESCELWYNSNFYYTYMFSHKLTSIVEDVKDLTTRFRVDLDTKRLYLNYSKYNASELLCMIKLDVRSSVINNTIRKVALERGIESKRLWLTSLKEIIKLASVNVINKNTSAVDRCLAMYNCIVAPRIDRYSYFNISSINADGSLVKAKSIEDVAKIIDTPIKEEGFVKFLNDLASKILMEDTLSKGNEPKDTPNINDTNVIVNRDKSDTSLDKCAQLRILMNKYPHIRDRKIPNIEEAAQALEQGHKYESLFDVSKRKIDIAYKYYQKVDESEIEKLQNVQSMLRGTGTNVVEENKTYLLSEFPEIKRNIESLLAINDAEVLSKIREEVPKALVIAPTILKFGKASDKQLRHINNALRVLNKG